MFRIMCFLALLGSCFQAPGLAADNATFQEYVVGSTFKTMAKAYIAAADLAALKEKNIRRIEGMKASWFERQYAEVYDIIRDLPAKIREKYHLRPVMSKAEVIAVIRALDKKAVNEIIDAVPDKAIAAQLARNSEETTGEKADLMRRITQVWDKIVAAMNAPAPGAGTKR
jgi:hypothetical protein